MNAVLAWSDGFFGWLWRATWQAAIVIILVLLAQRLLARQLTPRWRHALWFLVVVRLALPGSLESRLSLFNICSPPRPAAAEELSRNNATSAQVGDKPNNFGLTAHSPIPHFEAGASLRVLWVAGAVAMAVYLVGSVWRLGRTVRRRRPVTNEAVLNLLEDCKEEMGVFTPLLLLETRSVKSPALLGFIRPRLLLPEGLVQSFSLSELRYVFLHELGHLKRGDVLLNWLMALPLVLHWFNPLVWYAMNRMRMDGESACDDMALSHAEEGANRPYGQTMIKLLEHFSCPAMAPNLVGILEGKTQMERRIGMIARFKKTHPWPVLAATLFTVLALITLTDAKSHPTTPARETERKGEGATPQWRPWVIAYSPQVGDSEVDPALRELTVRFDRDMGEGMSWTWRDGRGESPSAPEGQRAYWRDQRTCVLPVSLEPGHYYRVELNPEPPYQNFRGADGRAAAQSVLYFTTSGASESVKAKLAKPGIVGLTPANGATDVDPDLKEIRVTFDHPMTKGYSWAGGGEQYPGYAVKSAYWIDEHTCVLPVALKPGHEYSLWINSSAAVNFQSASGGVPAEPLNYTFKTRP